MTSNTLAEHEARGTDQEFVPLRPQLCTGYVGKVDKKLMKKVKELGARA